VRELSSSKKTLVVGLGNPLSGDDSFGIHVLEYLQQHGSEPAPCLTLMDGHTDLLGRIEVFAEFDFVVIVDAVLDPEKKLGEPGRVVVFDEETFLSWPEASPSVHQVSPMLAIKLFRRLYPDSRTQIILVGLLVDQIRRAPCYLTDALVKAGADAVKSILAKNR
jgi:hydrogenase maturation protease